MEANYYIMLVNKAQNLKDTQLFGKQSPCVTLSVGKSLLERASTSIKDKGGCYCVWDETIYVEVKNNVEFLLIEVKSGSDLIGLARIAACHVSEFPRSHHLQLTDRGGKKTGKLTCSVQKFHGQLSDLHACAHALRTGQEQATVTPAANVFLKSISRGPVAQSAHPGGFQQPAAHSGGFQQPAAHTGGFQQRRVQSLPSRQPAQIDPASGT
jgi:hypothetical protein